MTRHLSDETLQMHVDGELSAEQSWEVEAHLGGCQECAERFETFVSIVESVGALEGNLAPPADLWPGIARRIQGETHEPRAGALLRAGRRAGAPRVVVGWILAAAAILTVGIALGRVYPRPMQPVLTESRPDELPAVLAAYSASGATYDQAIDDLLVVLEERRDELTPETVAVIEENLRIIDVAIAESRAALEADPANESLHRHLSSYMQTKLAVLRMVTSAVAADI